MSLVFVSCVDKTDMKARNYYFSFFALFVLTLLITACGPDTLKQSGGPGNAISALGGQCSCDSTYSPVCGSNGLTYENVCTANCYKIYETSPGNCECSESLLVCGDDKLTVTECTARNKLLSGQITKIVKFAPCGAATM